MQSDQEPGAEQPSTEPGLSSLPPNTPRPLLTLLDNSELRVHDLTLRGFPLGQTDLRLAKRRDHWQLWLNNDLATGKVVLPRYMLESMQNLNQQAQPLVIDLERLHVATGNEVEKASLEREHWQPADVSPTLFPPLQVAIDQFTVGEAQFGRWTFLAQPVTDGMLVENLSAAVDGVTLIGTARWSESEDGNRTTRFQGVASADNAADAIKAMGGTPTLSSKSADIKGNLSWPGAPFEFALPRLVGDVSVKLKDGVFYNVSSNAAGKLWGALNFETLMRRLQLNFEDLSESEMVYDEISGKIKLDRGILNLSKMKLNSPAIKMTADGKVDIEHDALDMDLDVTLPVTRNLVLPAAVIGGVPAAATAYVVEKMFGEQFDKLTTIKYDVKGTFDQPEIKVKDSFSIIPKQVGEAVMRNEKSSQEPPEQEVTP